jgi:type I restriction enzyme R subunit
MKTYSRHDFTREERAAKAKVAISAAFESKEQAFLDFVLSHYVRVGVQELDQEKLGRTLVAHGRSQRRAENDLAPLFVARG